MTEHEAFGLAYHEAHARYPDPDNWYDIAVFRWWQAARKWQRDELLTAAPKPKEEMSTENADKQIEQLEAEVERNRAAIDELVRLLSRYRNETPLGNQPHMIAHEADTAIEKHTPTTTTKEQ